MNGASVVRLDQVVHIVDDVVDSRDAVLGTIHLDRIVPFRIAMDRVDDSRSRNAAPEHASVLDQRECRLCPCKTAAIQDPRSPWRSEVVPSTHIAEGGMLSKIGIVRDRLLGRQVSKIVGAGIAKRKAVAIEPVLENDAQTASRIHEDLDDACLEVGKARRPIDLSSDVQEDRAPGLVVGVVEPVPLAERGIRVGCIPRALWVVIDELIEGVRRVISRAAILTQRANLRRREAQQGCSSQEINGLHRCCAKLDSQAPEGGSWRRNGADAHGNKHCQHVRAQSWSRDHSHGRLVDACYELVHRSYPSRGRKGEPRDLPSIGLPRRQGDTYPILGRSITSRGRTGQCI